MKLRLSRLFSRIFCTRYFPLLLLMATFFTYGYQLRAMGFYWDDWQPIFVGRLGDLSLYWPYYASDRPISAWTFVLTYPLFGSHPLPWQLFTIGLRFLAASGFWLALIGLWPRHKQEAGWMALLFALYPGFTQQSISVAYSQHLICYSLFTLSLAAMVWSARRPRLYVLLTVGGMLASLLGMLTMEYFVGLELLRPVILWFLARDEGRRGWGAVRSALQRWIPYALALVIFALFRFVLYPALSDVQVKNTPSLISGLLEQPLQQLAQLAEAVLQDFVHFNLFAWVDSIRPEDLNLNSTLLLASLVAGALLALAFAVFLIRSDPEAEQEKLGDNRFVAQAVVLGLLGIVLGGLPAWSTGRQATVGMWSSRFALGPMFGVVILLVGLIFWFVRSQWKRAILTGVLVMLAVSAQMRLVNDYRKQVITQREALWQIAWRIPALPPGTSLLLTRQIDASLPDYTTTYLANMIYAPDLTGTSLPYMMVSAPRYHHGMILEYTPGNPITYTIRSMRFEGNTSNAVALTIKSADTSVDACVRVLTPVDRLTPKFNDEEQGLVGISRPDLIAENSDVLHTPPAEIFGPEPPHTWCYYFEKADLATQYGDWEQVRQIDQERSAKGLKTIYAPELRPFIQAYAHLGDWQMAANYTDDATSRTPTMEPMLCAIWNELESQTPASPGRDEIITNLKRKLQCPKK